MHHAVLGVGSNLDSVCSIQKALTFLSEISLSMNVSPAYYNAAVGYLGPEFINLVVAIETKLELAQLKDQLRSYEILCGRPTQATKSCPRPIDIDILIFDQLIGQFEGMELPRKDIDIFAFVLKPLSELMPDAKHPISKVSFRKLWIELSKHTQEQLRLVDPILIDERFLTSSPP